MKTFAFYLLFLLGTSSCGPCVQANHNKQIVGKRALESEEVSFEGFIMDTYCIELGVLLDVPSAETLKQPESHSIHCLIEVNQCIQSGYQVLSDPVEGSDTYGQFCILDETGNEMVQESAKTVGACGTCDNTLGLNQKKGFRATVTGIIDPDYTGSPPRLLVSKVNPTLAAPDSAAPTPTPTQPAPDSVSPAGRPSSCGALVSLILGGWVGMILLV